MDVDQCKNYRAIDQSELSNQVTGGLANCSEQELVDEYERLCLEYNNLRKKREEVDDRFDQVRKALEEFAITKRRKLLKGTDRTSRLRLTREKLVTVPLLESSSEESRALIEKLKKTSAYGVLKT